nr:CPBP family intramembrane metalloprotease [Spirochaetales bacterium]
NSLLFKQFPNEKFAGSVPDLMRESTTGGDLWVVQIYIVSFLLCGLMLLITWLYLKYVEKLSFRVMISEIGLDRFSWKNMLLAVLVTIPFALFYKLLWQPLVWEPGFKLLDSIRIFHIPDWHWQKIGIQSAFESVPKRALIPAFTTLLIANHLGEEIFFRGFLFKRSEPFFGKWTFIAAGLLFILHHTFQASRTYPAFPVGIFITGYYAWRRDVYGCIFIHLIGNVIF